MTLVSRFTDDGDRIRLEYQATIDRVTIGLVSQILCFIYQSRMSSMESPLVSSDSSPSCLGIVDEDWKSYRDINDEDKPIQAQQIAMQLLREESSRIENEEPAAHC